MCVCVCVCVCVCIKPHMHTYIFKVWLNYNFLISSEKSFYFSIVSIILDKQTKKKKHILRQSQIIFHVRTQLHSLRNFKIKVLINTTVYSSVFNNKYILSKTQPSGLTSEIDTETIINFKPWMIIYTDHDVAVGYYTYQM